jgi:hypothetical protein
MADCFFFHTCHFCHARQRFLAFRVEEHVYRSQSQRGSRRFVEDLRARPPSIKPCLACSQNLPKHLLETKVSSMERQNRISPNWLLSKPWFDRVRQASFAQLRAGSTIIYHRKGQHLSYTPCKKFLKQLSGAPSSDLQSWDTPKWKRQSDLSQKRSIISIGKIFFNKL